MVLSCLIQQNGGSDAKSDGKLKPIVKIESDSEDDTATTSTSDAFDQDTTMLCLNCGKWKQNVQKKMAAWNLKNY